MEIEYVSQRSVEEVHCSFKRDYCLLTRRPISCFYWTWAQAVSGKNEQPAQTPWHGIR